MQWSIPFFEPARIVIPPPNLGRNNLTPVVCIRPDGRTVRYRSIGAAARGMNMGYSSVHGLLYTGRTSRKGLRIVRATEFDGTAGTRRPN